MKGFFDTSVLVPVFYGDHVHHKASLELAHCAIKAQAEAIYSWNSRHYALCGPEVTRRLNTP
jgi:predicted nucleic acid-binding protein